MLRFPYGADVEESEVDEDAHKTENSVQASRLSGARGARTEILCQTQTFSSRRDQVPL